MQNKTITFLSQDEALLLDPKPNSILVAIRDLQKKNVNSVQRLPYKSNFDGKIQTFFFFDYCKYRFKPTWKQSLEEAGWFMFDKKVASDIILFVESYKPDNLYIHCAAGISRSAAVAKYYSVIWNIPLTQDTEFYNKTVYGLMMEAGYKLGFVSNAIYKNYLIEKFNRQYARLKQLNKLPNDYTYVTTQ